MAKKQPNKSNENEDKDKAEEKKLSKHNKGFEIAKKATYAIAFFPTVITTAVDLTKKGINAAVESAEQIRSVKGYYNTLSYKKNIIGLSEEKWLENIKTLTKKEVEKIINEYHKRQNFFSTSSQETLRVINELLYSVKNDEERAKTLIKFIFTPGNESHLFAEVAINCLKKKCDIELDQTSEKISTHNMFRI